MDREELLAKARAWVGRTIESQEVLVRLRQMPPAYLDQTRRDGLLWLSSLDSLSVEALEKEVAGLP